MNIEPLVEPMWILIANGADARILTSDSQLETVKRVAELHHAASRVQTSDLMSDGRGKMKPRQSDASRHGAMAPSTDPQENEMERFAHEVAAMVRDGRVRNRFRSLLLVAAPAFLGRIRDNLDAATQHCVRTSLDKDYTDLDDDTIRQRLAAHIYPESHA